MVVAGGHEEDLGGLGALEQLRLVLPDESADGRVRRVHAHAGHEFGVGGQLQNRVGSPTSSCKSAKKLFLIS